MTNTTRPRQHDIHSDNYYERLGVLSTAGADEIKGAYRELALFYHPDHNENTPKSTELFKRLREAYATLSDPAQRRAYDNLRSGERVGDEQGGAHVAEPTSILDDLYLFHAPDGGAFASYLVRNEHLEMYAIRSRVFEVFVRHAWWKQHRVVPSTLKLKRLIDEAEMRAIHEGCMEHVYLRVGHHQSKVYLDLGDAGRHIVEVDEHGWRVIDQAPGVWFHRPPGLQALPMPARGGSISGLRRFIRVSDDQWSLIAGWLVGCLHPSGPYFAVMLSGPHGAAKSTTARILRALIDPNIAALRAPPKSGDDLSIAARQSWLVTMDNISAISQSMSDDLCRLATGGGASKRRFFSNDEEMLFADVRRPVLITTLGEMRLRADLLDRTIMVEVERVPDDERMTEEDLWRDFEIARPRIVGALLDAVSCALRRKNDVKIDRLPRMADAARWATAAEPALGLENGAFMCALEANAAIANDAALDSSPIAELILDLVGAVGTWQGTATNLLALLTQRQEDATKPEGWPRSARGMREALRAVEVNLTAAGVSVSFGRASGGASRGNRTRLITLRKTSTGDRPSPSPSSPPNASASPRGTKGTVGTNGMNGTNANATPGTLDPTTSNGSTPRVPSNGASANSCLRDGER